MYEIHECKPTEMFKDVAWRVIGPGVDRHFTELADAKNIQTECESAYHEGQLAAYRDAVKRITNWKPKPGDVTDCAAESVERD